MSVRIISQIPPSTESLSKAAVFVAVVRCGSFSGAAKSLQLARSTVSENIRALESEFGVKLLNRTTRSLGLTEEGGLLYERMEIILSAWDDAWTLLGNRREEPSGTLRVTAPSGLATSFVAPALCTLLRAFPAVSTELIVDDSVRDIVSDGIDLAIRMGTPADSGLVARLLGNDPRILVTSPELAATISKDPTELSSQDWIGHSDLSLSPQSFIMHSGSPDGIKVEITPTYRAHASNVEGMVSLLLGSLGIARLPSLLVRQQLLDGSLVALFPEYVKVTVPVHALYPSRQLMPRTIAFLDILGRLVD